MTDILLEIELGALPDLLRVDVDKHLEDCTACAAFAKTYAAVRPMVQAALEVEISETLQEELDAAVLAALQQVG